jgi:hypothetical protein
LPTKCWAVPQPTGCLTFFAPSTAWSTAHQVTSTATPRWEHGWPKPPRGRLKLSGQQRWSSMKSRVCAAGPCNSGNCRTRAIISSGMRPCSLSLPARWPTRFSK